MDFNERIMHAYAPLPYYLTYQSNGGWDRDEVSMDDFEYLQQTYPKTVKRYQNKIADIIDKMDYDGSMIYDEYPDKASVIGLADSILNILKRETDLENDVEENPEKLKTLEDIIRILLCNEIYKRRHCGKKNKIFKFQI